MWNHSFIHKRLHVHIYICIQCKQISFSAAGNCCNRANNFPGESIDDRASCVSPVSKCLCCGVGDGPESLVGIKRTFLSDTCAKPMC